MGQESRCRNYTWIYRYGALTNNKVIIARHWDIIEKDVILWGLEYEEENNIEDEAKENEKEDTTYIIKCMVMIKK